MCVTAEDLRLHRALGALTWALVLSAEGRSSIVQVLSSLFEGVVAPDFWELVLFSLKFCCIQRFIQNGGHLSFSFLIFF